MQDKPSETGLYWAETSYSISKKWDHIIRIKGKAPFLNYIGWSLNYPLHEPTADNGLVGVNPTKFIFGNKIDCNYDYSNNWKNKQSLSDMLAVLQKTTKEITLKTECLYWAVSKSKGDTLLVYITGTEPYMSCFTWNVYYHYIPTIKPILFNIREQIFDGNGLIYLSQIEEPEYEND